MTCRYGQVRIKRQRESLDSIDWLGTVQKKLHVELLKLIKIKQNRTYTTSLFKRITFVIPAFTEARISATSKDWFPRHEYG